MRQIFLILFLVLAAAVQTARAEGLTQDLKVDLDSVGDASVEEKVTYPARQWLRWQNSMGGHPDLVVRNKKREFAAWEIYDFSFSKDEVARVALSKMKVRAFAQITKEGGYIIDKLPRGLHLVTTKGSEWIFGGTDEDSGNDQTIHVNLPAGASNVHVVNPDSSQTQLAFNLPIKSEKTSPLVILATVFGLFGATILALALRFPAGVNVPVPQMLNVRKVVKSVTLVSGAKWQLVGRTPEGETLRLELTDAMFANSDNRLVLGRTADLCHVVLGTKSVSRQHAQIRKDGPEFKVADRNSSNGTAVNGQFNRQPFEEVPFKEGDTLTLGDVKLDFTKI